MKIYNSSGVEIADVIVDDSSKQHKSITENDLTLKFSLPVYIDIPTGSYADFEGERYYLTDPANLIRNGERNVEYTLILDSNPALGKYKVRDSAGRLKFPLTGRPSTFVQMIVDVLNLKESGWTVGTCIDAPEQELRFNHTFVDAALTQIAEAFKTEFEIIEKSISLRKIEYNKDNPLSLAYGKGKGFVPGTGRRNFSNSKLVEVLLVQGGERNIDYSKYGSKELLLPLSQSIQFDGEKFEDEEGFNSANARSYLTDPAGLSVKRVDVPLSTNQEDSLDLSNIYPSRVGTVTFVDVIDADKNMYDVIDNTIPEGLNYSLYRIAGEKAVIKFETGMLAGKEFDILQTETALTGYVHSERRFKIVAQEIDGITMPNSTFAPAVGDKYAIFGIQLPDAYICDNATKSGASWDMLREAVRYKYDNETPRYSFTGELDGIWAKKDWLNIGGKIKLGGYISFTDTDYQAAPVLIRIVDVVKYVNNPQSPKIELSNVTVTGGAASAIKKPEQQEVVIEEKHKESIRYTKRGFREAKETISMLAKALLDFSGQINPITVETMSLLVGHVSLQFYFVNSKISPVRVEHSHYYNKSTKVLSLAAGIIQHRTLGITGLSSSHAVSEYKFWDVSSFDSPALTDPDKSYYIYLYAPKDMSAAAFYLSETALTFDTTYGYYLLYGILNSEYEGDRSLATLYGFVEILPGRMTIDKVISPDGNTYINLSTGEIGGKMKFLAGSSGLSNITEFSTLASTVSGLSSTVSGLSEDLTDLDAYVDGAFHDGVISESEAIAIKRLLDELATSWTKTTAEYTKLYNNAALPAAQKTALGNAYTALDTAYDTLVTTINTIITDGKATAEEIEDYDTDIAAYRAALEDYTEASEDARSGLFAQYSYLKEAIEGSTDVIGGLVLLQLLLLKNADGNITAGLSGLTSSDILLFANDTDALNAALTNAATLLLRRDGTGNLGALKITKDAIAFCERGTDGKLGKAIVEYSKEVLPSIESLLTTVDDTVYYDVSPSYYQGSGTVMGSFDPSDSVEVYTVDVFNLEITGTLFAQTSNGAEGMISQARLDLELFKHDGSNYVKYDNLDYVEVINTEYGGKYEQRNINLSISLPKGNYRVKAKYLVSTDGSNANAEVQFSNIVLHAKAATAVEKTIFGKNGFVRTKSGYNYAYLTDSKVGFRMGENRIFELSASESDNFLKLTGTMDMPGLLAAGRVNSSGILQTGAFGKVTGAVRDSQGQFTISHSIGHTNYAINLTLYHSGTGNNLTIYYGSRTNSVFTVKIVDPHTGNPDDREFSFAIYGSNV